MNLPRFKWGSAVICLRRSLVGNVLVVVISRGFFYLIRVFIIEISVLLVKWRRVFNFLLTGVASSGRILEQICSFESRQPRAIFLRGNVVNVVLRIRRFHCLLVQILNFLLNLSLWFHE